MIRLKPYILALMLTLFVSVPALSQNTITGNERLTSEVVIYDRTDFEITVSAGFTNPYKQEQIALNMILTSPEGRELVLPCFYSSGDSDESIWKARFAPREVGEYSYHFELKIDGNVVNSTNEKTFIASDSQGNGFLHSGDHWELVYDSGKPFRGIGINIGWEGRSWEDDNHTYNNFFETLDQYGANFVRTWMHAWNLPLEWSRVTSTDRYSDTDKYFNPGGIERMDELMNLADKHGIYLMLALDAHGGFISDGEWPLNNYNSDNGGPVDTPEEFFTAPEARDKYKNRLRYLVARWGYSPHIAVWEFFNEIDNVANEENISDEIITDWHREMSSYLDDLDPYNHIISTSISHEHIEGLYSIPDMDINQRHFYRETGTIPEVLNSQLSGKPFVVGEFSREWDWNIDFSTIEGEMIHDYKRGLWYGLFNPTPILPMSWWWEWFNDRGLFSYFESVKKISDRMLQEGSGEFSLIESNSDFETHAVKTGSEVYVYLRNGERDTKVSSDVTLVLNDKVVYSVQSYNPETMEFSDVGQFEPSGGKITLPETTLEGWQQKVMVLDSVGYAPESGGLPELPVDFDDTNTSYMPMNDFGGNTTELGPDPEDSNNTVAATHYGADAIDWAGTALDLGGEVSLEESATIQVDLYSPVAGVPVNLKLEGSQSYEAVEVQDSVTKAGAWQTLSFNFEEELNGEYDRGYTTVTLFYNYYGEDIGEQTFYWDNIRSAGATDVKEDLAGHPQEVELNQNYPNPFNPSTNISYVLPEARHVSLSVFNIAGRKISTLVDKHQVAGRKQIKFNGSNLPSGMYIYRLKTGHVIKNRRMLLVK